VTFAPIELRGIHIDDRAPIASCNYCGGPIWWGRTARGKRNPFDVHLEPGHTERTAITHWSTCPERATARAETARSPQA
jgi:hypothetical protein